VEEWSQVYEENVQYVFRFLMYYLGNREDAEDVTQETFVRAFNHWEGFAKRSSARTWLISIARNLAYDWLRKNRRTKLLLRVFRREESVAELNGPEERLSQGESKRELYRAIQSLKPDYRTVAILRGIQDYSNTEVADILGWSESKVKVTFHRAVKSLGKKLIVEEEESYGLV
jgi:RNA polymerase sigma-70 factor, ECF subfamily